MSMPLMYVKCIVISLLKDVHKPYTITSMLVSKTAELHVLYIANKAF